MKRADLEAMGISKENIDKIMDMNGKDIESQKKTAEGLKEQLATANENLAAAEKNLKEAGDNKQKVADLTKQIEDYNNKEKERKENEEKEKADREFTDRIRAVFPQDKKFTSDYVENGVIADVKKLLGENDKLTAKEAFEQVTKDKEGIFTNPQHQKLNIPGAGGSNPPTTEEQAYLLQKYGNNPFFKK